MAQYILDKQINGLLTPYIERGSMAGGFVTNPPSDYPTLRKNDQTVFYPDQKKLEVYDASGNLTHTISLSEADTSELEAKIQSLESEQSSIKTDIQTLYGKSFEASTAIAATDLALAATDVAVKANAKQAQITRDKARQNQIDIGVMEQQLEKALPKLDTTTDLVFALEKSTNERFELTGQTFETVSQEIEKTNTDVTATSQQVTQLDGEVEALDQKVTGQESSITTNASAVEALTGEVAEVAEELGTLATSQQTTAELVEANTNRIGEEATKLEELDGVAVKKETDAVLTSVSAPLIQSSTIMHFKAEGVIGIGLYGNYASFANLEFVTGQMAPKAQRQAGHFVTWGALQEELAANENVIQHGDNATLNSLDMGHGGTNGFIKNLKAAEADDDAVNLKQTKALIDSIWQADINLYEHNIANVNTISGKSAGEMQLVNIKQIKFDSATHDGLIYFGSGNLQYRSTKHSFRDLNNNDNFTIYADHSDFHTEARFKGAATFDKNVTFGVDAAVSISNALNMNDHSISHVRTANEDHKATNVGHIKQLIAESASSTDDVINAVSLAWSPTSDPRTNTKRIISAAPVPSVIVGNHDPSESEKLYHVVSKSNSSHLESLKSNYVIFVRKGGHATGMSTTESSSGKVWSRILDGSRGVWDTSESKDAFSLSEDIPLNETPEGVIYFTQDKGVVVTDLDESGNTILTPLEGYHSPQLTVDVASHSVDLQTLKDNAEAGGHSRTEYFKNSNSEVYGWPGEDAPLVDAYVLDTHSHLIDSYITLADGETHKYSGQYNSVGVIAISGGLWSAQYAYHNAYKHQTESYYVVFSMDKLKWLIVESDNPHTSIGSRAASVEIDLGGRSSLPQTFDGYTIETYFDDLDSLHFSQADPSVIQLDNANKLINLNFGQAFVSGFVVIK